MHSRSCLTVAEGRSHAFPDRSHLLRFVMRYAAAPRDRVGSSERSSGVRLQPSAGTGAFRPAFPISYPHYVKRELLDWSEMTRDNKKSPAMAAGASLTRAAPLTTKSASRSPHSVQRNNRAHRSYVSLPGRNSAGNCGNKWRSGYSAPLTARAGNRSRDFPISRAAQCQPRAHRSDAQG